jgi:hypothetical protein
MTPEGRIKKRFRDRLKEVPYTWIYMPVPGGFGKQALDYLGCTAGWFWAAEAKAPGKAPTPRQYQTMSDMNDARAVIFIVDSEEAIDRTIATLKEMTRRPRWESNSVTSASTSGR